MSKDKPASPGECWEFSGARSKGGYGQLRVEGRTTYAHRVAYENLVGPIPEGAVVRHSCDNPPCVNPAHLKVGTQGDNVRDMVERGRHGRGMAKLTWAEVRAIRTIHATGLVRQDSIAWGFDVGPATISEIVNNKAWRED